MNLIVNCEFELNSEVGEVWPRAGPRPREGPWQLENKLGGR